VQLEARVPGQDESYDTSGNVLLDYLLGATVHHYPDGEDEAGAHARLQEIAAELRATNRRPYVIPLGPGHPPLGALGYVRMARELLAQCAEEDITFDEVVLASGSGATHAGTLFGLRALGCNAVVTGACVRRAANLQRQRIIAHCEGIAQLLGIANSVTDKDVGLTEEFLTPGYGRMGPGAEDALLLAARSEGHGGLHLPCARIIRGRQDAALSPHRRPARPLRLPV
jgi:D-cysteine desulfhydrase/L-cysteate sulfo-lyase